jgi:hypothetical protein
MLLPALAASQTLPGTAHGELARAIFEEPVEINTVRDSGRLMRELSGKVAKE